jgi:hypothetical protein
MLNRYITVTASTTTTTTTITAFWRRVVWSVGDNVSEKHSVSIFKNEDVWFSMFLRNTGIYRRDHVAPKHIRTSPGITTGGACNF